MERVRQSYGLWVYGYVVTPEHVHLLVNEPERGCLSQLLQSLKQSVARTLALRAADSFWQARYYDFVDPLGFARDFRSGLGRPLNASASMCGASLNCGEVTLHPS